MREMRQFPQALFWINFSCFSSLAYPEDWHNKTGACASEMNQETSGSQVGGLCLKIYIYYVLLGQSLSCCLIE